MAEILLKQDLQSVYDLADQGMSLGELMEAICAALARHADALQGITYSYRLHAEDTGYEKAFALVDGRFAELTATDPVDVTVSGKEENLRLVFQRKLSPIAAMITRKMKVAGNKAALMKLGEFFRSCCADRSSQRSYQLEFHQAGGYTILVRQRGDRADANNQYVLRDHHANQE